AEGDVEIGSDDLAGLADLVVVRRKAGIDGGAGRADRAAERVGQAAHQAIESLFVLQGPPSADYHPRFGQVGTIGSSFFATDELAPFRETARLELLDRTRRRVRFRRFESGSAD